MSGCVRTLLMSLAMALPLAADGPGVLESVRAAKDFALKADPNAKEWKGVRGVIATNDSRGNETKGHRTEIRSRWTDQNLYLFFLCPYEAMYLIPNGSGAAETNKLWEHDVAEAFIGSDFQNIRRYKEFQVSPQGEWVDLDIDRDHPLPEGGWRWNSGFHVAAKIDEQKKVWYGVMQIPFSSIDTRSPKAGNELRANFYRFQGPPPNRNGIAWQPTGVANYHVPEAFGKIKLADK